MPQQQQLSGTIVVIIIAVGVQACIIVFIFVKRQVQRFALRNRRGPHMSIGHGAPKVLRREADRLLEYVSFIKYEPPLQIDLQDPDLKRDYRKQVIVNFQAFESDLAAYSQNYIRPVGANVRSHVLSCVHGPLMGVDPKLIQHVCDDYDAARHHYEVIDRQKFKVFIDRLDKLRAAVRANKLVKPHPSPMPPPSSSSPRKRRQHKQKQEATSYTSRRSSAKTPLFKSSIVTVDNNQSENEDVVV